VAEENKNQQVEGVVIQGKNKTQNLHGYWML